MRLYQAMLLGKDGGYYRLIGIATAGEAPDLEPEFPKIARASRCCREAAGLRA